MNVTEQATVLGLAVLMVLASFEGWDGLLLEALR